MTTEELEPSTTFLYFIHLLNFMPPTAQMIVILHSFLDSLIYHLLMAIREALTFNVHRRKTLRFLKQLYWKMRRKELSEDHSNPIH